MQILLFEGNAQLARSICNGLEWYGFQVHWGHEQAAVEAELLNGKFDVLLLAMDAARENVLNLLKRLHSRGGTKVSLVMVNKADLQEFVDQIGFYADEFIVKPFELDELRARLCMAILRVAGSRNIELSQGALQLDPMSRMVKLDDQLVPLTEREFELLSKLLAHRGSILSKMQLRGSVSGWSEDTDNNSVEVHVHHLRRKLGRDFIKTVQGLGYMIEESGVDKK